MDTSQIKPGDTVAIQGSYSITLQIVDKVTLTGRIKIKGNYFDKNGRLMGEHYYHSHIVSMENYYKEEERKKLDQEKRSTFNQIKVDMRLSVDQLTRILNICNEVI